MGMSLSVVGVVPDDDEWKKMKAIWDACKSAGIDPPREVERFFDDTDPDESGRLIHLTRTEYAREWRDDCSDGYEIDISKLPPHVKVLRFYASW